MVNEQPGALTLVALGPLTNVALATKLDPEFTNKVKRVVLMAGTTAQQGNHTMVAEFNVAADPEAAHIVFASFALSTMARRRQSPAIRWRKDLRMSECLSECDLCERGAPAGEFRADADDGTVVRVDARVAVEGSQGASLLDAGHEEVAVAVCDGQVCRHLRCRYVRVADDRLGLSRDSRFGPAVQ
jgi:hypothetical protein